MKAGMIGEGGKKTAERRGGQGRRWGQKQKGSEDWGCEHDDDEL